MMVKNLVILEQTWGSQKESTYSALISAFQSILATLFFNNSVFPCKFVRILNKDSELKLMQLHLSYDVEGRVIS